MTVLSALISPGMKAKSTCVFTVTAWQVVSGTLLTILRVISQHHCKYTVLQALEVELLSEHKWDSFIHGNIYNCLV